MKKKLIQFSDELWQAIDAARGDTPRNPWLEAEIGRLRSVRNAADTLGIKLPKRESDGRGRWKRPKQEIEE